MCLFYYNISGEIITEKSAPPACRQRQRQRDAAPLIHGFDSLKKFYSGTARLFEPELLIFFLPKNSQNYFTLTVTRPQEVPLGCCTLDAQSLRIHYALTENYCCTPAVLTFSYHYYSVSLLKRITLINHIRFSYHGSKSFQAS